VPSSQLRFGIKPNWRWPRKTFAEQDDPQAVSSLKEKFGA
jgi:hypothetical protein